MVRVQLYMGHSDPFRIGKEVSRDRRNPLGDYLMYTGRCSVLGAGMVGTIRPAPNIASPAVTATGALSSLSRRVTMAGARPFYSSRGRTAHIFGHCITMDWIERWEDAHCRAPSPVESGRRPTGFSTETAKERHRISKAASPSIQCWPGKLKLFPFHQSLLHPFSPTFRIVHVVHITHCALTRGHRQLTNSPGLTMNIRICIAFSAPSPAGYP
ncbi:hypothetical protein C8Q74DRAFT_901775 [Fomes fomentarius]|nr:hypothetical protein C8Q74DRAFT_901775 [Fomes fomentarius]